MAGDELTDEEVTELMDRLDRLRHEKGELRATAFTATFESPRKDRRMLITLRNLQATDEPGKGGA